MASTSGRRPPRKLTRLARVLRDPRPEVWEPASRELAACTDGRPTARLLLDIARGNAPFPPARAIPGLQLLAPESDEALDALIALARQAGSDGPLAAATALGELAHLERAQAALTDLAHDSRTVARLAAGHGLRSATATSPAFAFPLIRSLAGDADGLVRQAAVQALEGAQDGRAALSLLDELVRESDDYVCQGAALTAAALVERGVPKAQALLLAMAGSAKAGRRWAVAYGLARIRLGTRPRLRTVLRRLGRDENAAVRYRVAVTLGVAAEQDGRFALGLLAPLLDDPDRFVRGAAAEALAAGISDDGACPAFESAVTSRDEPLRLGAAAGLVRLAKTAPGRAQRAARELATDPSPVVRAQVAAAVWALPREEVQEAVPRFARDRDPQVRGTLARALARLGRDQAPLVRGALLGLSEDAASEVRAAAAQALGQVRPDAAVATRLTELATDGAVGDAAVRGLAHGLGGRPRLAHAVLYRLAAGRLRPGEFALLARETPHPLVAEAAWAWRLLLAEETIGEGPVQNAAAALPLALDSFRAARALTGGDEICAVYEAVRWLLAAGSIEDLAHAADSLPSLPTPPRVVSPPFSDRLADLAAICAHVDRAVRSRRADDRIVHLSLALAATEKLAAEPGEGLNQFETRALSDLGYVWRVLFAATLTTTQARAELQTVLISRTALRRPQVQASIAVTNLGRGAARRVILRVTAGGGVIAERQLGDVGPNETREAQMLIPAPATARALTLRGYVHYDDDEQAGRRTPFRHTMALREPGRFRAGENPYIVGKPLEPDSAMFFGRDDIFDFLDRNLRGEHQEHVVALIGPRRIGKTSLLRRIGARLADRYHVIFLDVQGLLIDSAPLLFYELANRVAASLRQSGVKVPSPNRAEFEAGPSVMAEGYLQGAVRAAGGRHLLILLDEFDDLEQKVRSGLLPESVFSYLRHLIQHQPGVAFILCGTHRLEDLGQEYWSFLFNLALHRRIGCLPPDSARRLIREPLERVGTVCEDLAVEKVWRLTGGHPYFTQLACHRLVDRCHRDKHNSLAVEDVDATVEEIGEWGGVHLAYLWERAEEAERLVLAALAEAGPPGTAVTPLQLAELLRPHGDELAPETLHDSLLALTDQELLERWPGAEARYSLRLGLLGHWISIRHPLARIALGRQA